MVTETKKKPAAKKVSAKKKSTVDGAATQEVVPAAPAANSIRALGRRKTSIASVRITPGTSGDITINGKPFESYFTTYELRGLLMSPIKMVGLESALAVDAKVHGGGIRGQAEAVRLGMCRALVELNAAYRKTLKKLGYLTRDPRAKERKKFGLKRARRAPQWSKR